MDSAILERVERNHEQRGWRVQDLLKRLTGKSTATGDKGADEKPVRAPRGTPLDVRKLLAPLALALMIVLTAVFAFQTVQSFFANSASANTESVSTTLKQQLAGYISEQQRKLAEALIHPEIERYFASPGAGDPVRALSAVRERMPEVEDIRFVGADVLGEIGQDIGSFGYANAEMLLSAARLGAPAPAQVHGVRGGQRELVLVNPVTINGSIAGFALAKLAYAPVREVFSSVSDGGLRVALLQGESRGAEAVIEGTMITGMTSTAVPGTMLRVATTPPAPLILLGSDGVFINGLMTVFALLASVLVTLWRKNPELLERLLHRKSTDAAVGTVAERAVEEAKLAAEKAAAKAAASGKPSKTPQPETSPKPAVPVRAVSIDRSIFRAYDIRGVVGSTLSPSVAKLLGQAIGSENRARGFQTILVGRDGRLSGPELSDALISGLVSSGCDVIDIGMVATPVLYFGTYDLSAGSGVMVTGSHNPPDYNGFKIMLGGETLAEQDIQALYARIVENRLDSGRGALTQMDIVENYIERISSDIQLEEPLKVVIDCGNGSPGAIAGRLFESIGCEVVPLYCEVDGTFPNHHPDPSDPHNLEDLIVSVKQLKADIGLAFDGDGDRLGVVTPKGKIIYPDRLLMAFARDVLVRSPGATIIYDVKCTGHLSSVILGHGGSPIMWKTGHSLIKRKMKETGAELAGEMSGHFFFKERWLGFDDGMYAGCRLLEILAGDGRDADEFFDELPQGVSTPELKIPMAEGDHYRFMDRFKERSKFDGARLTTIDGVRADWPDGWGLIRCSNTTPCLVLRFDADNGDALARIQTLFKSQILALDAKLSVPF